MMNGKKTLLIGTGLALVACTMLLAATPPPFLNYQGVLRDSSGAPLDGTYHMIFRFWNAETGGDEILIDEHPEGHPGEVVVSGGLFNVTLGTGDIFDGSGPGTYASLAEVFRDHSTVWLEVEVHPEVLTPRIRIVAAAYAVNADHLDGNDSSFFLNTSSTTQTKEGKLIVNSADGPSVVGESPGGGAYFSDTDHYSYARLAHGETGVDALGSTKGAYFRDSSGTGDAHIGYDGFGIKAGGVQIAGRFDNYGTPTFVELARDTVGVWSEATFTGGYFKAAAGRFGEVSIADDGTGVSAVGEEKGGEFHDSLYTGSAVLAEGNVGIRASGVTVGGEFHDQDNSGSFAYVGYGGYGIEAHGEAAGGYFLDEDGTGNAFLGDANRGISSYGSEAGGYFEDTDSSAYASVADGEFGIRAFGDEAGGYFEDSNGSSIVWVGRNDNGISSYGSLMGGYFEDTDNATVTRIAYGGQGIESNGAKNFVQNHPYDDGKVVVYSSLEGDEVGTYTRGSARLENGVATVSLGETFRWVTNPDIGLTVHLTPLGQWSDLYVIEKSTKEITVGSLAGAPDAAFDYIVHGLRIGFEEIPPVREKDGQAFIPSMAEVRQRYEADPALRGFNALERFKKMASDLRGVDGYEPDLDDAAALRAAIQEYDPEIHGRSSMEDPSPRVRQDAPSSPEDDPAVAPDGVKEGRSGRTPDQGPDIPLGASLFQVVEAVEPGDLLVLDPEMPGQLRKTLLAADPAVIGVVAAETLEDEGALQAPVVGTGFAVIKVDASYGAVMVGDLLTSSPTPGHAMTAFSPAPGTVVGKAMEPLEQGTGRIRALVNVQ